MRWLPNFEIPWERSPSALGLEGSRFEEKKHLSLRWLGTAGYEISALGTTVLLDPFVSRPGLPHLLSRSPLIPCEAAGRRYFPKADFILVGHSHYDHLLDVPEIALRTGATVVGSASTCRVARARGVPEDKLREVPPAGGKMRLGSFEVQFIPSRHGKFFFGRVPLDGEITHCPHGEHMPANGYRVGNVFGIWLKAGNLTLYHNGSADLVDAELEGLKAQVHLVGLAGRFATPDYFERLARLLSPEWIFPTHYDAFFAPLEAGLKLLPAINLRDFFRQMERFAPRADVVMPAYEEPVALPLSG
ncbi:MAG: MBL fold metallo-hydrolase [Bdellovibrionota bacterium]